MRRAKFLGLAWLLLGSALWAQTPITQWVVMGGFEASKPESLIDSTLVPGEPNLMPAPGDPVPGLETTWQAVEASSTGEVDLWKVQLPRHENTVVYAVSYVYSPREADVTLRIGSDDGIAVWVNGNRVHRNIVRRGYVLDEDKARAHLKAGWNHVLVKVFNGVHGFAYGIRVTDANGGDVLGLLSVAYPPASLAGRETGKTATLANVRLEPRVGQRKGRTTLGLKIVATAVYLGEPPVPRARMTLSVPGVGTKTTTIPAKLAGDGTFRLSAREVLQLLRSGQVTLSVEYKGHGKAERTVNYAASQFLNDLFARTDLPEALRELGDQYRRVHSDMNWAEIFTDGKQKTDPRFPTEVATALLEGRFRDVESRLESVQERLKPLAQKLKQNTIHLAGHAHIDMAWLWRYDPETIEVCRSTFASALSFAREYPDFVYVQSSAQAYAWMEERYPELFEQIRKAYQEGHWFPIGGMWVEPDLNLPSGESLVRQILYGKRYFMQKFGIDIRVGFNPDTFGYSWTLPQIYRKAGFKYFVTQKLRWNDTTPWEQDAFWWEGPDGSRVLTLIPYGYVHTADPRRMAKEFVRFQKITGLKDHLVLYGVGNHGGGPTRRHLRNIRAAQSVDVYPVVKQDNVLSTMEAIEADPASQKLPVIRDELYLQYHRGTYTTHAKIKKRNRQSEIMMDEAEKLAVISGMPYPSEKLLAAWRKVMLNQFHDILPGSAIPPVYEDANRDYDFVEKTARGIIRSGLEKLASQVDTRGKGTPVLVFNPLSWTRTGVVRLEDAHLAKLGRVVDAKGKPMLSQVKGTVLLFLAEDVPALGYKVFWVRKGGPVKVHTGLSVSKTALENRFLRAEIDPRTGNLKRVVDKVNHREILTPGKEGNVLQALGDLPDQYDAWNIQYTGKKWLVDDVEKIEVVDRGQLRAALRVVRRWRNSRFEQTYVLYAHSPRLDVETHADWHAHHVLLKALFPLNVETDVAVYEIPYGTIARTTHPKTPAEKAKFEVPGHKFVDMSDGTWGVALLNDCKYGFDAHDDSLRMTLLRSPKTPRPLHAPANYEAPFADQGEHWFNYAILPHKGKYAEGRVVQAGYEFNVPLLSLVAEKHRGTLPPSKGYVGETPVNVIVSVLKKAEENDNLVLRLYETAGRRTEFSLAVAFPFKNAWEADLLEHADVLLPKTGQKIQLTLQPYEIKTVVLEKP